MKSLPKGKGDVKYPDRYVRMKKNSSFRKYTTAVTVLLVVIITGTVSVFPAETVVLSSSKIHYNITHKTDVMIDKTGALSIDDVLRSAEFIPHTGDTFQFGYTGSAVWIRTTLHNLTKEDLFLIMEDRTILDVNLYCFSDNGQKLYEKKQAIDDPFSGRDILHRKIGFKIPPSPAPQTFLFKLKTRSYLSFRMMIWDRDSFYYEDFSVAAVIWSLFGFLFIMAIYNLSIFFSVRDRTYLYYSLYTICIGCHYLVRKGIAMQYLWPDTPGVSSTMAMMMLIVGFIMNMLFAVNYLDIPKRSPRLTRLIYWVSIVSLLNTAIIYFTRFTYLYNINLVFYFITGIGISVLVIRMMREGSKPAKYYFFSWIAYFIFGLIGILFTSGTLVIPYLTIYSGELGPGLQVLLLSLGLSDKINSMRKELLILNTGLERKVKERTEELSEAIEELEVMNTNLAGINHTLEYARQTAEHDMEMAVNVQKNFLPSEVPEVDGWDIEFFFRPMKGVSGDFYDFYTTARNLNGIAVFDVSGHGISSGLVTMIAKSMLFRNFTENMEKDLGEIMISTNLGLYRELSKVDHYLSGILLRFGPGGTVEYCNAGHPDIFIKHGHETWPVITAEDQTPLGLFLGITENSGAYETVKFGLEKNDIILIYTDCLIEARNEEEIQFGYNRLTETLKHSSGDSARDVLKDITETFNKFRNNITELHDDLTIIVVRRT